MTFSTSPPMFTSTVRPVREAHPRIAATVARSPSRVPTWAISQPASVPSPLAPSGAPSAESGSTEAASTTPFSGAATPFVYVICVIAMLLAASGIIEMARELPSAGAFYTYVARGLVPPKRHTQFRKDDGSLYITAVF